MNPRTLDQVRQSLAAGEAVTVAGLGDSLTQGYLVTAGFFDRFCDGLAARFPAARLTRVNAGVAGETVRDGLARVDEVLRHGPQLVVVEFGINDCFGGVYRYEFEETLSVLAGRLRDGGAAVVLVTGNPLRDPVEQDALRHFYTAIRDTGRRDGHPVAHLDQLWLAHQRASAGSEGLFQPDGIHPTDAGHELLALGLLTLFE